jgi:hypothetical protein
MRGVARVWTFAITTILASCVGRPIVYDSSNMQGDAPTGSVAALGHLLGGQSAPLRIVFLHGVGDHCAGYAIDPRNGWLNDKTARHLGLVPLDHDALTFTKINISRFMGGSYDANAYVQYGVRNYRWKLPGASTEISVQALEITWSNLTQWIKTEQLSYDSPSVFPPQQSPLPDCVQRPDPTIVPPIKNPPSRLWLDKIAKENVFDRDLADAVIYSGTYSPVIQRGVAEALCHAITNDVQDDHCVWPDATAAAADPYQYLFVTHSLGGRILYDLLLNLTGNDTEAKPNPFSVDGKVPNVPFVSHMLSQTPAVYMMANQLSLIGLANMNTTARSIEGPVDYLARPSASAPAATVSPASPHRRDILSSIADARGEALRKFPATTGQATPTSTLNIIAFSDTNDLLTWHVPSWYGTTSTTDPSVTVRVTNVFVRNSCPFVILESPPAAHSDYFINKWVGDVIICGAANGKVARCPQ